MPLGLMCVPFGGARAQSALRAWGYLHQHETCHSYDKAELGPLDRGRCGGAPLTEQRYKLLHASIFPCSSEEDALCQQSKAQQSTRPLVCQPNVVDICTVSDERRSLVRLAARTPCLSYSMYKLRPTPCISLDPHTVCWHTYRSFQSRRAVAACLLLLGTLQTCCCLANGPTACQQERYMSEGLRLGPMQLDVGLQTAERNVKTLNFICDSCATASRLDRELSCVAPATYRPSSPADGDAGGQSGAGARATRPNRTRREL